MAMFVMCLASSMLTVTVAEFAVEIIWMVFTPSTLGGVFYKKQYVLGVVFGSQSHILNPSIESIQAKFIPQPVGVWMMNADWKGEDQSGFGNDATPNDVTLTTGPMGEKDTAYQFYGRATSYLSVTGSSSMDVGANGSFTFSAFVKIQRNTAAFIDYNIHSNFGLHIWAFPKPDLYINMPQRSPHISKGHVFTTLPISLDSWHFVAVSYDKPKSNLLGLLDDKTEIKNPGSYTVYTKTANTLLGSRNGHDGSYLLGEMSCAMLFSVALSLDDIKRAKKYCTKLAKPYESIFKEHAVGNIPIQNRLKAEKGVGILRCVMDCHRNDGCMSVSHSPIEDTCVLSNIDFLREDDVVPLDENSFTIYTIAFT